MPKSAAIVFDQLPAFDELSDDCGRASSARPSPRFTTGVDAIVRLMHAQAAADRRAGLDTAGFISGYRGSPLGGLDRALWRDADRLAADSIRFQPALNEEFAATAIIGTQQAALRGDAEKDGVFSVWYGKGVGADRASDALKHGNLIGTSKNGGVLVVVGDDHGADSSATAHQCEQAMMSWMMPVLHPAHIREFVAFGLLGFAMSRFSGCYVGFKAASETIETSCTLAEPPLAPAIAVPGDFPFPEDGVHIRWPDRQVAQERRHVDVRLRAVKAFARANSIDRTVWRGGRDRIGIVAVGKAFGDTLQALNILGIDREKAAEIGVALYKVGMPWPLEPDGLHAFAEGLETVFVVEEKRSVVEPQIKDILYHRPAAQRPDVIGKCARDGGELLPSAGQLTGDLVARALRRTFPALCRKTAAGTGSPVPPARCGAGRPGNGSDRPPFFCAGCPHNQSTRLPQGSSAHAGTGCHLMAAFMDRDTTSLIQMGGEGVNWIGEAPFVKAGHIFQNLGDGTYLHSGSLAVRQAVAAGANMTFKLLFNDVVAMTGGQPLERKLTPADISRQAAAEGVRRVAVVHDGRHDLGRRGDYAPGTSFHERGELDRVQRELRDTPGVTMLIYVQTCATELRRRRRRGLEPRPDRHVFINPHVCEDCGDCVRQSNCIALTPVDTGGGRKRGVDQTMCNRDFACLEGFCPAFVTVTGTPRQTGGTVRMPEIDPPAPEIRPLDRTCNIVLAGIGGTGVVTIGHLLGAAAAHDGIEASVLDFTGLSQMGGNVVCHVRLANVADHIPSPRVPEASAGLLIACDLVTATGGDVLSLLSKTSAIAVANTHLQPTAAQVLDPDVGISGEDLQSALMAALPQRAAQFVNATRLAETLTGSALNANMLLLGFAWQKGRVPLSRAAIERTLEAPPGSRANLACFQWGRLAAHDPVAFERAVGPLTDAGRRPEALDDFRRRMTAHLTDYQNAAYARRFNNLVDRVAEREGGVMPATQSLTAAVARGYAGLLAYKDEFEVARLHATTGFLDDLKARFEPGATLRFHLAPEFLGKGGPDGARPGKWTFGAWLRPVLGLLARGKVLRGSRLDPFARLAERRAERAMIAVYETAILRVLDRLTPDNHGEAVRIAQCADAIRGFGPVKGRAMTLAQRRLEDLLLTFETGNDRNGAASKAAGHM